MIIDDADHFGGLLFSCLSIINIGRYFARSRVGSYSSIYNTLNSSALLSFPQLLIKGPP